MSETLVRERKLTAEEFYDLYAGSDQRVELVDGEVVEMPPSGPEHGALDSDLHFPLKRFVKERGLGKLFINTGFILNPARDLVRGPDQAFVSQEKLEKTPPPSRGFWKVVPDLVIEIVSPDDRAQDLADKVADYLEAGVRITWVVYPRRQQVYVHRPGERVEVLGPEGTLEGGDVLPGFQLPLAELWGA